MKDEERNPLPRFATKSRVLVLLLAVMTLTVPWPFAGASDAALFGFPVWAVWAATGTVVFAAIIAVSLGRYWSMMASPPESDANPDADVPPAS